jgi:Helicase associated domain
MPPALQLLPSRAEPELTPTIRALRSLFLALTFEEFESECLLERIRRQRLAAAASSAAAAAGTAAPAPLPQKTTTRTTTAGVAGSTKGLSTSTTTKPTTAVTTAVTTAATTGLNAQESRVAAIAAAAAKHCSSTSSTATNQPPTAIIPPPPHYYYPYHYPYPQPQPLLHAPPPGAPPPNSRALPYNDIVKKATLKRKQQRHPEEKEENESSAGRKATTTSPTNSKKQATGTMTTTIKDPPPAVAAAPVTDKNDSNATTSTTTNTTTTKAGATKSSTTTTLLEKTCTAAAGGGAAAAAAVAVESKESLLQTAVAATAVAPIAIENNKSKNNQHQVLLASTNLYAAAQGKIVASSTRNVVPLPVPKLQAQHHHYLHHQQPNGAADWLRSNLGITSAASASSSPNRPNKGPFSLLAQYKIPRGLSNDDVQARCILLQTLLELDELQNGNKKRHALYSKNDSVHGRKVQYDYIVQVPRFVLTHSTKPENVMKTLSRLDFFQLLLSCMFTNKQQDDDGNEDNNGKQQQQNKKKAHICNNNSKGPLATAQSHVNTTTDNNSSSSINNNSNTDHNKSKNCKDPAELFCLYLAQYHTAAFAKAIPRAQKCQGIINTETGHVVMYDGGSVDSMHDVAWNAHYAKLLAHQKRHGHGVVPLDRKVDEEIYHWLGHQRRHKRDGLPALTAKRMELLEAVGVEWDVNLKNRYNRVEDVRFLKAMAAMLFFDPQAGGGFGARDAIELAGFDLQQETAASILRKTRLNPTVQTFYTREKPLKCAPAIHAILLKLGNMLPLSANTVVSVHEKDAILEEVFGRSETLTQLLAQGKLIPRLEHEWLNHIDSSDAGDSTNQEANDKEETETSLTAANTMQHGDSAVDMAQETGAAAAADSRKRKRPPLPLALDRHTYI